LQRPDGELVTIYYFSTEEDPQQRIIATIWDPAVVTAASVDERAMDDIAEHIDAVEESMKEIVRLSQARVRSVNAIVRRHQIKEEHCDQVRKIVSYHFMSQRLKPAVRTDGSADGEHLEELALLHEILLVNMKAKQTTDLCQVERLRALLRRFRAVYCRRISVGRQRG
jgi:nickel superoxide dismutase